MLPPQPPPIPNPENEQRHAYAYHSKNHCNNNIYNDGDTNFRLFSGSYCRWHRWVEYGFTTAVVTNHIFCTDLDHICLIQVNISKGVVRFSSLVCFSGNWKRETGNGKRETGNGKRETGNGKRETGNGKRETGRYGNGNGNGNGNGKRERERETRMFWARPHAFLMSTLRPWSHGPREGWGRGYYNTEPLQHWSCWHCSRGDVPIDTRSFIGHNSVSSIIHVLVVELRVITCISMLVFFSFFSP